MAVAFVASLFEGRVLPISWTAALLAWALLGATGLNERSSAARWSGYVLVGVGVALGAADLLAKALA